MSAHKNHLDSSQNSEQSEDFIRPMFQKLPPNQIISERYEPDTSAHFKLILNKDQRRNNLNFIPPKTRNQQLLNYADLFNMFDYLGHNYVNSINQTVYLKFNNSKYNVDPTEKHLTRIMPAFYIPFQHIYNNTQIFFTKNIGLHFPQVYHNSFLPHIKSNKGCSLDPVFNSNYQSSNLFAAIRKNPFQYDLILQNDINSCQKVNWFNFVVQFRSEGYYSFNIANMTTDMSKLFQNGMKISYCYVNDFQTTDNKRTGEGWSLCGQNIKFSKSHIQRQNKKGESYYQLYFQYKCKNKNDVLMFAFQTPYTTMECQKYFNNVTVKKIKNMMILQKTQFGKTISGSPLYSYVLKRKKYRNESFKKFPQPFDLNLQPIKQRNSTNLLPINKMPTSNNLDNRNKSIVILTRMEGSDISGSYILQGIIDYLLENIEYQSLKKTIEFYFIPMVNIDAIKYGNSAANLTGSILHKNWKNPHNIYQSQIFCLKQFLHEINKESPINLILNLGSEHKDIYSSVISIKNERQQIQDSRIFPHILSRRHKLFSFEKCYFYDKNENNSMCCVLKDNFPKSLVYQMNISHFQMKKDEEDSSDNFDFGLQLATTDSYRSFGKQLIADYLQHIKISQKNSLLKQKWLREIQEVESKFQRVSPVFMEEKKIEERFLESFYLINNPKSSTNLGEIKSHNNLSHKHIKPPLPQFRRHSKLTKKQNNGPKGANHHAYFELNKANGYFKGSSNTEISQDIKKQQVQDTVEKPVYQVKISNITAKKTSILNNFPPNILNLITQGQSKKYISRQKSRLKIQKQPLKKQLSIRLLKKVKVQDVNRSHKKQQPSTQKSFANF